MPADEKDRTVENEGFQVCDSFTQNLMSFQATQQIRPQRNSYQRPLLSFRCVRTRKQFRAIKEHSSSDQQLAQLFQSTKKHVENSQRQSLPASINPESIKITSNNNPIKTRFKALLQKQASRSPEKTTTQLKKAVLTPLRGKVFEMGLQEVTQPRSKSWVSRVKNNSFSLRLKLSIYSNHPIFSQEGVLTTN